MRTRLALAFLLLALAPLAAACGAGEKKAEAASTLRAHCAYRAGWQKLADKISAPVYCPGWLPDPLLAQIGGKWSNIDSVSKDRSYLESFVWQETGGGAAGGELHVNLRGYPGRTAIPTCTRGGGDKQPIPCFSDARGTVRANGIRATMYTVNQDADQWHVLLAWRAHGNLYTLSEHVALPLTYLKTVAYVKRELRALVLVRPAA